jgi:hypothetical protein
VPESNKIDEGVCRLRFQNRVAWQHFLAWGKGRRRRGARALRGRGCWGHCCMGESGGSGGRGRVLAGEVERCWG